MVDFLEHVDAVAHGKVNLHLGVGDVRPDGYHELVSVFQSLSVHDEVSVTVVDTGVGGGVSSLAVRGVGGGGGVPTDNTNLAWRAVDLVFGAYRDRGHRELPVVDVGIRKGIPVAGGMAGGSADAAAALLAAEAVLAPAYGGLGAAALRQLACKLGSDVPFTLVGGTMLGTGRGEQLVPVLSRGTYHWVLALNSKGLSTPVVFSKLDQMRAERELPRAGGTERILAALARGDIAEVADALVNDLQAPATSLLPALRRTLDAGKRAGALAGIVSGSGPTCAFLCADAAAAVEVADALIDDGVTSAVTTATGPAAGAYIKG